MKKKTEIILATDIWHRKTVNTPTEEQVNWIYLGENAINASLIGKKLPNSWLRISIAQTLQQTAIDNHAEYVRFISGIAKNKDLEWWTSRVSEKNPFVSKSFLHICYLITTGQYIRQYAKDGKRILIIIEDNDVFRSIVSNYGNNISVNKNGYSKTLSGLANFFKIAKNKTKFVLVSAHHIILTNYFHRKRNRNTKGTIMIVHTFANERSFDNEGRFKETYFGGMVEFLARQKKQLRLLPRILKSSIYGKTAKKLISGEGNANVMLWYEYITIADIFRSLIAEYGTRGNLTKKEKKFNGIDISAIIDRDEIDDMIENRRASDRLLYFAIKRMAKKGLRISEFLYTYENQCWEKILISALR
ncbi:MAG: hypothetical protein ABIJ34_02330, partial [archaeon]